MIDNDQSIERAALDWLVRVNDPAFDDWDGWQAWLTADPRHDAIYWRMATMEAEAVSALASGRPASQSRTRPATPVASRRAWMLAAAVLAASLLGVGGLWSIRPQPWVIETGPGEIRRLELADGSAIAMAGGTRLRLDRRESRRVELEAGRALFEIAHDDRHPFAVGVGDISVTDLGTIFDVTRLGDSARIDVAEGEVRVDRHDRTATLGAGEGVIAGAAAFDRRRVAPATVGAWRDGRLVYDDERLSVVAADLAIALGHPVLVSADLNDRRLSASLSISGPPEDLRGRLEQLLDARVTRSPAGWLIAPRPAP